MSNARSVSSPPGKAGEKFDALIAEFEILDTADAALNNAVTSMVQEFEMMGDQKGSVCESDEPTFIESQPTPVPVISAVSAASAASAASVASAAVDTADTVTSPQSHVLHIVWDADGCAYNSYYRRAIFFFINEYKGELDKIQSEKNQAAKEKAVAVLLNSLREKIERGYYESKTEDEFRQVYAEMANKATQSVVGWLKKLPLSTEQIAVLDSGDVTSAKWHALKEYLHSFGNQLVGTYLLRLESGQCINWMMKIYLDMMNSVSEEVSHLIFASSNKNLTRYIQGTRRDVDKVVLMVGSNRQSYHDDLNCSWLNSTGSFFKDLKGIIPELQKIFSDKPVVMDPTTMTDLQNGLFPGETFNRVLSGHHEHASYHWDEKKGTILYAFCHRAMNEHPKSRVTVDFFDDREDIIIGLEALFTMCHDDQPKGSDLLPKGLTLNLIRYDGDVRYKSVIEGTGDIDSNYMHSSIIMSTLSESTSSSDGSRVIIDSVNALLTPGRAKQFMECRDAEKKKLMTMSLVTSGSSSFFAQQKRSVVDSVSRSYTFGCTSK